MEKNKEEISPEKKNEQNIKNDNKIDIINTNVNIVNNINKSSEKCEDLQPSTKNGSVIEEIKSIITNIIAENSNEAKGKEKNKRRSNSSTY